jgi:hypothetical protein
MPAFKKTDKLALFAAGSLFDVILAEVLGLAELPESWPMNMP